MRRLQIADEPPFLQRDTAQATTHLFMRQDGSKVCIITALPQPSGVSNEQYAALIAHEALHVVQYVREAVNCGNPLGDETESYMIQHILMECLSLAWNTGRTVSVVPKSLT